MFTIFVLYFPCSVSGGSSGFKLTQFYQFLELEAEILTQVSYVSLLSKYEIRIPNIKNWSKASNFNI